MVEWISTWAQGIIVAVIIATIIEMILPNGNCKKYIKVVIGIYILFTIVSPIITKVTGNNFNISEELNLDKFYEEADSKSIYNELNENNSDNIKNIYIANLKTDIESKLKNKNYYVVSCEIEIENEETYEISKVNLTLEKDINVQQNTEENNNVVNNIAEVNEINIQISQNTQNSENKDNKRNLTMYEKNEVKEYLQETYDIKKENIIIN